MTSAELARKLAQSEDVFASDVELLTVSADALERLTARTALAKTALRQALAALCDLAREQAYQEQGTLDAIARLATLSDVEEPYIETLKQLALQATARGDFEKSMALMQETINRGMVSGLKRDARSRSAMRYAYDSDLAAALESWASRFIPPAGLRGTNEPLRLSLLCSALQDEDAPSVVTLKRAAHFRALGFDVEIVSTEMANSDGSRATARAIAQQIPFFKVVGPTWAARMTALIRHYDQRPANAVVFEASAHDNLAKLASCIGLAPVQAWDNKGAEPQIGRLDLVSQGLTPEQETQTKWKGGVARYHGPYVALGEEIDAAVPLPRAALGVPQDAILLATFGRIEKCNTTAYLESLGTVLGAESRAWLVLAGRDSYRVINDIVAFLRSRGAGDRVVYLGQRQADGPALLKTIDVYCDTYPWVGGQSLVDAMQAGVPIVAMKRAADEALDPSGCSTFTALADVLLGETIELAGAGSVTDYVRIARGYVQNAELRRSVGQRVREKAVRDCSMRAATQRFAADIRRLVEAKRAVVPATALETT